jgi:hypothetical protein
VLGTNILIVNHINTGCHIVLNDVVKNGIDERQHRARLVDMYLAAGGIGLTANEGKVLAIFERSGVFLAGGVLVGTPAFRALGNNLCMKWLHDYRTKDLDLVLKLVLLKPQH